MPSSHLILCRPLLLLPSIFPSIRVFSNESVLHSHQVAKVLEFQLQHQSFQWIFKTDFLRMDWLDLLAVQGTLKSLLQCHSSKASILWHSAFFIDQISHPYVTTGKTIALTRRTSLKRDPGLDGKESACNARDPVQSLGLEDPLEEMATHSISCLENPMDRGAWWATVHGVAKSQTWLNDLARMWLYIMQRNQLNKNLLT